MCAVEDPSASNGMPTGDERGVLANLPRSRPQRDSPRRAAARRRARAAAAAQRAGVEQSADSNAHASPAAQRRPPRPAAKRAAPRPAAQSRTPRAQARGRPQEAAPRQGFESDGEEMRRSVHPPGGAELIVSAAEIVTDLAKAGLSRSERLVRDIFSRFPLS
jgi:hypothetical protein